MKIQLFLLNKHLLDCYDPLFNFQSSEKDDSIFPVFLISFTEERVFEGLFCSIVSDILADSLKFSQSYAKNHIMIYYKKLCILIYQ